MTPTKPQDPATGQKGETRMSHTPVPWAEPYFDEGSPEDRGWWIHNGCLGSDEFAIAVTFDGNPNAEADARFIVRAVNAHEDLLAALKAAQFGIAYNKCTVCAGWDVGPNGETEQAHTKDCIVALAIAKAESK